MLLLLLLLLLFGKGTSDAKLGQAHVQEPMKRNCAMPLLNWGCCRAWACTRGCSTRQCGAEHRQKTTERERDTHTQTQTHPHTQADTDTHNSKFEGSRCCGGRHGPEVGKCRRHAVSAARKRNPASNQPSQQRAKICVCMQCGEV